MTNNSLPAPASRHALALLRFPDPRTDWVIFTLATLKTPINNLAERIEALHKEIPLVGARLRGETWIGGAAPTLELVDGDPLGQRALDRPFDLANEAPVRFLLSKEGDRLAIATHHAAFDGRGMLAMLRLLTEGVMPTAVESPPPGEPGSKMPLLKRFIRPADALEPTPGIWPHDSYAVGTAELSGRSITGRLAAAAVGAAVEHQQRRGSKLHKVGLTIAVGGPPGVGNVASYRRIDVAPTDRIVDLVQGALASSEEPGEQVNASKTLMRMLQPVAERFSDTILITNLGRHEIGGVSRVEVFPVARGRSAACIGSCAVVGGETALIARARDLSPADTRRLLERTSELLAEGE